jgi:hypothetical protein
MKFSITLFIMVFSIILAGMTSTLNASVVSNTDQESTEENLTDPKPSVVGQLKGGKAVFTKKKALLKALNDHYQGVLQVIDLRFTLNDDKPLMIATAKQKNGDKMEIGFRLAKNGDQLLSTNANSESCSGCSHCAFATGGGCDCVDNGSCNHTTTKETSSLSQILETQPMY